jgi:hypothetical protein
MPTSLIKKMKKIKFNTLLTLLFLCLPPVVSAQVRNSYDGIGIFSDGQISYQKFIEKEVIFMDTLLDDFDNQIIVEKRGKDLFGFGLSLKPNLNDFNLFIEVGGIKIFNSDRTGLILSAGMMTRGDWAIDKSKWVKDGYAFEETKTYFKENNSKSFAPGLGFFHLSKLRTNRIIKTSLLARITNTSTTSIYRIDLGVTLLF